MVEVRSVLTQAIRIAERDEDTVALAVYRDVMTAMDEAEVVPVASLQAMDAVEFSPLGVGTAEATRRTLTEQELRTMIRARISDLRLDARQQTESLRRTELEHAAASLAYVLDGLR